MAGIAVKIAATPTALAGSRPPRAQRVLVRSATLCRSRDSGVAGRDSVIASRLVISVFFSFFPRSFAIASRKFKPSLEHAKVQVYLHQPHDLDGLHRLPAGIIGRLGQDAQGVRPPLSNSPPVGGLGVENGRGGCVGRRRGTPPLDRREESEVGDGAEERRLPLRPRQGRRRADEGGKRAPAEGSLL
jgi:hypothetical protein